LIKENKQNSEKKIAGERAAEFIENGMTVGLGTGSTVFYAIKKLGQMVREGLKIQAVSTSDATSELSESLNIKIISIEEINKIDITLDGADEVDKNFNGIKGGGGALLFEKIVALISKNNIWIVDSGKLVDKLGRFPLPIEVIPFGYKRVYDLLDLMKLNPVLRKIGEKIYITDSGNYIIDLHLKEINNSVKLNQELKQITGIIETGLFIDIADIVIVGKNNSVEILRK